MGTTQDTHPIYIAKRKKNDVKSVAVGLDIPMKTLIERYVAHGEAYQLQHVSEEDDPTLQIVESLIEKGHAEKRDDEIVINIDPDAVTGV